VENNDVQFDGFVHDVAHPEPLKESAWLAPLALVLLKATLRMLLS
jgi:hypothetical protein